MLLSVTGACGSSACSATARRTDRELRGALDRLMLRAIALGSPLNVSQNEDDFGQERNGDAGSMVRMEINVLGS